MIGWLEKLISNSKYSKEPGNTKKPRTKIVLPIIEVEGDPVAIFKLGNVFTVKSKDKVYRMQLTKKAKHGRLIFRVLHG